MCCMLYVLFFVYFVLCSCFPKLQELASYTSQSQCQMCKVNKNKVNEFGNFTLLLNQDDTVWYHLFPRICKWRIHFVKIRSFIEFTIIVSSTILTTLIAALILFILGSGPVKGFALTLGIGILTTLFSVYFIARLFTSLYVIKNKDKEKLI